METSAGIHRSGRIIAIAAFFAFVVTRSWTVRPGETVWLWPRYATWGIVVAIAGAMVVVAGWLIAAHSGPDQDDRGHQLGSALARKLRRHSPIRSTRRSTASNLGHSRPS